MDSKRCCYYNKKGTTRALFPQNTEEELRVCKSVFLLLLNRQHPDVLYNCLGWEQLSAALHRVIKTARATIGHPRPPQKDIYLSRLPVLFFPEHTVFEIKTLVSFEQ